MEMEKRISVLDNQGYTLSLELKNMNNTIACLTVNELRTMLANFARSATISFISITPPKMKAKDANGTPNPFRIGKGESAHFTFGCVRKQGGIIGADYDTMVENRNEKAIEAERAAANLPPLSDDEMKAEVDARFRKGTSWWRYILKDGKPTVLAVNKNDARGDEGNAYLVFSLPTAVSGTEYVNDEGDSISYDEIAPFMTPPSTYDNQGLKDGEKVEIRTVELSNIIEIVIGGFRYRIIDNLANRPMKLRNRLWEIAGDFFNGDRRMSKV